MKVSEGKYEPRLRPRGEVLEFFSRERDDLDEGIGKIHKVHDKNDKLVGYKQTFRDVTGYMMDVVIKRKLVTIAGKKMKKVFIVVKLESGKDLIDLEIPFSNGYGRNFASHCRNFKISKEMVFMPWQLPVKEGQKYGSVGMSFYFGSRKKENKIEAYYTRDNMPEFKKRKEGATVFDPEAQGEYLYDKLVAWVYKTFNHYEEEDDDKNYDEEYNKIHDDEDDDDYNDTHSRDRGGRSDNRGGRSDRDRDRDRPSKRRDDDDDDDRRSRRPIKRRDDDDDDDDRRPLKRRDDDDDDRRSRRSSRRDDDDDRRTSKKRDDDDDDRGRSSKSSKRRDEEDDDDDRRDRDRPSKRRDDDDDDRRSSKRTSRRDDDDEDEDDDRGKSSKSSKRRDDDDDDGDRRTRSRRDDDGDRRTPKRRDDDDDDDDRDRRKSSKSKAWEDGKDADGNFVPNDLPF